MVAARPVAGSRKTRSRDAGQDAEHEARRRAGHLEQQSVARALHALKKNGMMTAAAMKGRTSRRMVTGHRPRALAVRYRVDVRPPPGVNPPGKRQWRQRTGRKRSRPVCGHSARCQHGVRARIPPGPDVRSRRTERLPVVITRRGSAGPVRHCLPCSARRASTNARCSSIVAIWPGGASSSVFTTSFRRPRSPGRMT